MKVWGGLSFYATATNGVINLAKVLTFDTSASLAQGILEAGNGGKILAPKLNAISNVSLYLDDINSALVLTNLASISGGGNYCSCSVVAGPGAVLNLSSVQSMQGPGGNGTVNVYAQAGAFVDLSGVTAMNGGSGLNFYATETNGVIDLLGLQTFNGPGTMSQANGGLILVNTNAVFQNVSFQLAPKIISGPQCVFTVGSDLTVTYSVTVSASSPVYFRWYSNSIPIVGGTGSTLVLNNAQPSWSGTGYSVVVSNAYGSATSPVAVLTIPTAPLYTAVTGNGQIQVSPSVANYYLGQTFTLIAMPGNYSAFSGWSDANPNNPRTIVINTSNYYTAIFTNASPSVNIAQVGGQAVVFYPTSGSNCVLMTTTNLANGPWVPATNGVSVIAVTFTNIGPGAFFQLQCQ
jgi:hypothetical protein